MTKEVRRRSGTGAEHTTFTGAPAEVTVDTTDNRLVVHDGSTAGGHPLAKEDEVLKLSGGTMTGDIDMNGYSIVDFTTGTIGDSNTTIGYQALYANTIGTGNTASGYRALFSNTTGNNNTANGRGALYANTTGDNNTASGYRALFSNTTGNNNTANGWNALQANTTGYENTAIGRGVLYSNTTGFNNTASGYRALNANTTGNKNTAIGREAGVTITTGNNNTAIGYNAQTSSATVSGEFILGDSNVTTLRCNTSTISALSDERDKTDIIDTPFGLDFIMKVQPRQFKWDSRDGNAQDGKTRQGFIAQELMELDDGTIDLFNAENPDKIEAKAGNLLPIAIKAIQELSQQVSDLQTKISELEGS